MISSDICSLRIRHLGPRQSNSFNYFWIGIISLRYLSTLKLLGEKNRNWQDKESFSNLTKSVWTLRETFQSKNLWSCRKNWKKLMISKNLQHLLTKKQHKRFRTKTLIMSKFSLIIIFRKIHSPCNPTNKNLKYQQALDLEGLILLDQRKTSLRILKQITTQMKFSIRKIRLERYQEKACRLKKNHQQWRIFGDLDKMNPNRQRIYLTQNQKLKQITIRIISMHLPHSMLLVVHQNLPSPKIV